MAFVLQGDASSPRETTCTSETPPHPITSTLFLTSQPRAAEALREASVHPEGAGWGQRWEEASQGQAPLWGLQSALRAQPLLLVTQTECWGEGQRAFWEGQ